MFLNIEVSFLEKPPEKENSDNYNPEDRNLESMREVQRGVLKICRFFLYLWILSALVGNVLFYGHFFEFVDILKNDLVFVLLTLFMLPLLLFLFFLGMFVVLYLQYLVYKGLYKTGVNGKYHTLKSVIFEKKEKTINLLIEFIKKNFIRIFSRRVK